MNIAEVIRTAIAPVFLISGIAATLSVLTNRLTRVVDRARTLEDRLDGGPAAVPRLHDELRVLAKRARYINSAITLCGASALLVAMVVVSLFANAFFRAGLEVSIALLFTGAMLFLTAAFVAFLVEVRTATAALRIGQKE